MAGACTSADVVGIAALSRRLESMLPERCGAVSDLKPVAAGWEETDSGEKCNVHNAARVPADNFLVTACEHNGRGSSAERGTARQDDGASSAAASPSVSVELPPLERLRRALLSPCRAESEQQICGAVEAILTGGEASSCRHCVATMPHALFTARGHVRTRASLSLPRHLPLA